MDVILNDGSMAPRPTVLLLDEVDALIGDTLITLLCQLRASYTPSGRRFFRRRCFCEVCVICSTTVSSQTARRP